MSALFYLLLVAMFLLVIIVVVLVIALGFALIVLLYGIFFGFANIASTGIFDGLFVTALSSLLAVAGFIGWISRSRPAEQPSRTEVTCPQTTPKWSQTTIRNKSGRSADPLA